MQENTSDEHQILKLALHIPPSWESTDRLHQEQMAYSPILGFPLEKRLCLHSIISSIHSGHNRNVKEEQRQTGGQMIFLVTSCYMLQVFHSCYMWSVTDNILFWRSLSPPYQFFFPINLSQTNHRWQLWSSSSIYIYIYIDISIYVSINYSHCSSFTVAAWSYSITWSSAMRRPFPFLLSWSTAVDHGRNTQFAIVYFLNYCKALLIFWFLLRWQLCQTSHSLLLIRVLGRLTHAAIPYVKRTWLWRSLRELAALIFILLQFALTIWA